MQKAVNRVHLSRWGDCIRRVNVHYLTVSRKETAMNMSELFRGQPITEEMLSVAREIGGYQRTAELSSGRVTRAVQSQRTGKVDADVSRAGRYAGIGTPTR